MAAGVRSIFKRGGHVTKRGRLIAAEGIDGGGKTSLFKRLHSHLSGLGWSTVLTNWNETSTLYNMMMQLNAAGRLDGPARCALGGAELAARYHYVLRQPLASPRGAVIAVKYLVSAFAHALIRGEDEAFVRQVYAFAYRPDLTVYVDVPPEVAAQRKIRAGSFGFWECGLDCALPVPLHEVLSMYERGAFDRNFLADRFIEFQTALRELHLRLLPQSDVLVVDGSNEPDDVFAAVAPAVEAALAAEEESLHNLVAGQAGRLSDGRP
jgi:dTMP kinase